MIYRFFPLGRNLLRKWIPVHPLSEFTCGCITINDLLLIQNVMYVMNMIVQSNMNEKCNVCYEYDRTIQHEWKMNKWKWINNVRHKTVPKRSLYLSHILGVFRKNSTVYSIVTESYHKPTYTIRSLLVKPKDQTSKKCGVIYKITCPKCDQSYIGETARPMGIRLKEHIKTAGNITSAIGEHISQTGHPISIEDVKIVGTESDWHRRKIKEAI